ncbi:hypothetical protein ABES02_29615, partial [Neobacillus pocheonensis]|uniref:hypothetical protein n=1 Tax=Neobacillus pocheonensis TaxID=363869 RepID=UPI003D2C27EE
MAKMTDSKYVRMSLDENDRSYAPALQERYANQARCLCFFDLAHRGFGVGFVFREAFSSWKWLRTAKGAGRSRIWA